MNDVCFGNYTYKELYTLFNIDIDNKVKNNQIDNLKYLNNYSVINIKINNFDMIDKIIDYLEENNRNNYVIFELDEIEKNRFTDYFIERDIKLKNVFIRVAGNSYRVKLSDYLKYEKTLYDMIKPAINLSPFEKYIYAYNVVKKFKLYKENKGNPLQARDLYEILNNEYIVCSGYSLFLGDLLNKLGIPNVELNMSMDPSYDDSDIGEFRFSEAIPVDREGHSRRYVHLIDEKYGINGFYHGDPTWDAKLGYDYYNYLLFTDIESTETEEYIWLNSNNNDWEEHLYDIFNVESIEEYINKIRFIINRADKEALNNQIKYILSLINVLDNKFYNNLSIKYNLINELPSNVSSLIYDIGEYIVGKVNNYVDGQTIFKGVKTIYDLYYGFDNLKEELDNVRIVNQERHDIVFPKRYKIDKDGHLQVIMNGSNKFDFDIEAIFVKHY